MGVPGMDGGTNVPSSDTGGRNSPMRGWGVPSTTDAAEGACGPRFLCSQKKITRPAAPITATPPTTPPAMAPEFDEELWVGVWEGEMAVEMAVGAAVAVGLT